MVHLQTLKVAPNGEKENSQRKVGRIVRVRAISLHMQISA